MPAIELPVPLALARSAESLTPPGVREARFEPKWTATAPKSRVGGSGREPGQTSVASSQTSSLSCGRDSQRTPCSTGSSRPGTWPRAGSTSRPAGPADGRTAHHVRRGQMSRATVSAPKAARGRPPCRPASARSSQSPSGGEPAGSAPAVVTSPRPFARPGSRVSNVRRSADLLRPAHRWRRRPSPAPVVGAALFRGTVGYAERGRRGSGEWIIGNRDADASCIAVGDLLRHSLVFDYGTDQGSRRQRRTRCSGRDAQRRPVRCSMSLTVLRAR